jgi:NADH-quinone oxidoreductase subunit L
MTITATVMTTTPTRMPRTTTTTIMMRTATAPAGYHPHESPITMLIPLVVLSIGAVFAGIAFRAPVHLSRRPGMAFWKGSLAFDAHLMHAAHEVPLWVKLAPFIGDGDRPVPRLELGYIRNTTRLAGALRGAVQAGSTVSCYNKWYFDELYNCHLRQTRLRDRPLLLEARR